MHAGWGVALCYRTLSNDIQNHWLICSPLSLVNSHPFGSARSGPGREAAKRTLAGENRSGIIQGEGKGGQRAGAKAPSKKGPASLHFIGPFPFFQRPSLGAVSEPSRRDKYRR